MAASEQQVENLVGMLDAYASKGGHHLLMLKNILKNIHN